MLSLRKLCGQYLMCKMSPGFSGGLKWYFQTWIIYILGYIRDVYVEKDGIFCLDDNYIWLYCVWLLIHAINGCLQLIRFSVHVENSIKSNQLIKTAGCSMFWYNKVLLLTTLLWTVRKLLLWQPSIHPVMRLRTRQCNNFSVHYIDVIMTTMASQITSLTVVYSIVYSGAYQRKHQSSASLVFVRGIHRDRWIPRTKGQ